MYIYLITNNEHFKIGFTKNIEKRIKQLQTGSSFKIELVSFYQSKKYYSKIEKALHNGYQMYQTVDNEWFNLPLTEVLNFKENCRKIENNFIILETYKNNNE